MRSLTITLALAGLLASAAHAQSVRDFAGAYELVRIEALGDDGEWRASDQLFGGPDPSGVIMYDGVGTMGVHIIRGDVEEERGTPRRYYAYWGRYTVDATAGTVTHHLRNHVDPRQVGSDFERAFDFDGEYLTLMPVPARNLRLVWRRIR